MTDQSNRPSKDEFFGKALFDVEHALGMYAISFCTLPAEGIYDKEALASVMEVVNSCHIYLIGYTPKIEFIEAQQNDRCLNLKFTVLGNEHTVVYDLPEGFTLKQDGELSYLEDADGRRCWPNVEDMQLRLSLVSKTVTFEVKYVGQAYGQGGSRNAIDRLLKHETLQKIALRGVPAGYRLTLLLLAIQPNNQLFTAMNPFAKNQDDGSARIKSGLDKLFNTTEPERIALYEAALIRYFYPEFNIEFKNSFPSTNLKILQDCYEKDFSAIVAEICIDELPFMLCSETIKPAIYHIAKHDLHKDEERRMFFGL
ncbi:hypothetical protein KP003_00370 [Geomonas nitrogeniifigens]|uniref:hypothetical protein n=1 Tax=Geomonas diazotrophica TaxID=2843197 RepID=UPI001C2BF4DE|nr:hypothetical protein [Geomonas nitrogeniifigens]QXE86898.1 hypothetical protein KP003_00370 [Geomonas nitrogeniifigens]